MEKKKEEMTKRETLNRAASNVAGSDNPVSSAHMQMSLSLSTRWAPLPKYISKAITIKDQMGRERETNPRVSSQNILAKIRLPSDQVPFRAYPSVSLSSIHSVAYVPCVYSYFFFHHLLLPKDYLSCCWKKKRKRFLYFVIFIFFRFSSVPPVNVVPPSWATQGNLTVLLPLSWGGFFFFWLCGCGRLSPIMVRLDGGEWNENQTDRQRSR